MGYTQLERLKNNMKFSVDMGWSCDGEMPIGGTKIENRLSREIKMCVSEWMEGLQYRVQVCCDKYFVFLYY